MNKERLLNFTDAVAAIVLTIMLIEVKQPADASIESLIDLAEPVLVYVLSFVTIIIAWYSHHQLFKNVKNITYKVFWYNIIWIFLMGFTPMTTAWVGRDIWALLPELVLATFFTLWMLSYHFLLAREILKSNRDADFDSGMNSKLPTFMRIFIVLASFAMLWFFPPVALILLLSSAVLHIVEHVQGGGTALGASVSRVRAD